MIGPTVLIGVLFCQGQAVAELIRSLDDDDIGVRRKATDELLLRGSSVEEALWVAMLRGGSLEVRLSAGELLKRMGRLASSPYRTPGAPRERLDTVTDDRRFGKLRDDPPQVDFDR
jgi:hypothetical protein